MPRNIRRIQRPDAHSPWYVEYLFRQVSHSESWLDIEKRNIPPDPGAHVSASGSEETASGWTWRNGDNGVLVTLEHELSLAVVWVPELDAAILGA